nr:MAG TPA: Repressor protein CI [Caudoviricetes sp.]
MQTDAIAQEAAKLARRFRGRSKAAFAREFAVPGGPSMISQHISGHRPISLEAAAAYARGFGVPLEEISPRLAAQVRQFGGPDSAPAPLVVKDDDAVYASVRTVKLRVSAGIAGFAIDVDEMPGQPIFFRRDWLRLRGFNPAKLHAIKVKGRSMEPTLYADDMIVFNEADTTPRDGDVFVINFAGEVVVKRLIKEGPVWWMHSDNTDQQRYPRVRCDEHCLLLGRVVHRQSETI